MENYKKEKLRKEPAFGCVAGTPSDGYLQEGMSKRFYAACAAMNGIMAGRSCVFDNMNPKRVVEFSYELADELLKQENE